MGSLSNLNEKYSAILIQNGIHDPILSVTESHATDLVGEHMGSKILYTTIKFRDEAMEELTLFIKSPVIINHPGQERVFDELMLKEGGFLTKLVPEMKEYCSIKLRDSNKNKLLQNVFPKAFYADNNSIVLEKLNKDKYFMMDKTNRQDMLQCTLVLKALAELHAVSNQLIVKSESKEKFQASHPYLDEMFLMPGMSQFCAQFFDPTFKILLTLLKGCANPEAETTLTKLEEYSGKVLQVLLEAITGQNLLDVVNHGDCWNNNMMFSKAQDHVILLDFQCNRICSPCIDLSHYIFSTTKLEVRRNWKQLLQIYYDHFKYVVVDQLGGSMSFTYEDLCREFSVKAEYGFIFGVMFSVATDAVKGHDAEKSETIKVDAFGDLVDKYISDNPHKVEDIVEVIVEVIKDFEDIRRQYPV